MGASGAAPEFHDEDIPETQRGVRGCIVDVLRVTAVCNQGTTVVGYSLL